MRPIKLDIAILQRPTAALSDRDRGIYRACILYVLEGLTRCNVAMMRSRKVPRLYESGIRYELEPETEDWKDCVALLRDLRGDCEDLTCYRTAELRVAGIRAEPWVSWRKTGNGAWIYHMRVWRPTMDRDLPPVLQMNGIPTVVRAADTGYIEDPSRILGMGANGS